MHGLVRWLSDRATQTPPAPPPPPVPTPLPKPDPPLPPPEPLSPVPQPDINNIITNVPAPVPKSEWEIWAQPVATIGAGLAVIGAALITMLIAWLARRQLEKQFGTSHELEVVRSLRDRYTAITAQLADSSITVRSAGVYAISALADDWLRRDNRSEAQACIDVLCGYLRAPYSSAAEESNGRARTTIRRKVSDTEDVEEHYDHRPDDADVRKNIVRVISRHLAHMAEPSWSALSFDFEGATFTEARFMGSIFERTAIFRNAKFLSGAPHSFAFTRFNSSAYFTGAVFEDNTGIWFNRASFEGRQASFAGTQFRSTFIDFSRASFNAIEVDFSGAYWNESADLSFDSVDVSKRVTFKTDSKPPQLDADSWPPRPKPDRVVRHRRVGPFGEEVQGVVTGGPNTAPLDRPDETPGNRQ